MSKPGVRNLMSEEPMESTTSGARKMAQEDAHSSKHWTDLAPKNEVAPQAWKKLVPSIHLKSPVSWELVDSLDKYNKPYTDYPAIIKKERLPMLFPKYKSVFAGGLYTDGDQRVYFEGSDPTKPLMRVPQQGEPEDIVTSSYPWDRVNFVYQEVGLGSFMFYLYTPANLGSYGLVVENEEEVYFKPTLNGNPEEEFTLFQIEPLDQMYANIRAVNMEIGLSVDSDAGIVKATSSRQQWSRFKITGFTPQNATAIEVLWEENSDSSTECEATAKGEEDADPLS